MAATTNITVGGATVSFGASNLGYIKDGVTITPTLELFTVDGIEQLLTPSKAWRVSETFEVTFTLVEPTQANIEYAWDLATGFVTNAVDFGVNQFAPVSHTTNKLTVTGVSPGTTQGVRTITLYNAVLSTPAPIKFTKSEETNLVCTFMALYDDDGVDSAVGTISDTTS